MMEFLILFGIIFIKLSLKVFPDVQSILCLISIDLSQIAAILSLCSGIVECQCVKTKLGSILLLKYTT